jgi:hypothetical protein
LISQATTTKAPVWGPAQGPGPVGTPCAAGEAPAYYQQPNFTLNTSNSGEVMGNKIRYPEGVYFNTAIAKTFPIHDRISLQFRADIQNVLNIAVLNGSIQEGLTSSTYGQNTGLTENNDPRFIRLKAILSF